MRQKISLLILLSFSAVSTYSKTPNADSLRKVWNNTTLADTLRVQAFHELIWYHYLYSNNDSALILADQEYNFAKEHGLKRHMGASLDLKATVMSDQGDYKKAIELFTACLQLYTEANHKRGIAVTQNGIGSVHYALGDLKLAKDYYLSSNKSYTELNDINGIAITSNNLGNVHADLGEDEQAINYYKQALTIHQKTTNERGIANSYNNIAYVFADQGLRLLDNNEKQKAYALQDSAIVYFNKCVDLYSKTDDKQGLAIAYTNIGSIYVDREDYAASIPWSKKSLDISIAENFAVEKKSAAGGLYEAYRILGKNTEALEMYELYIATRDSLQSADNQRAGIQHEYDKKEILLKAEQEKKDAIAAEKLQRRNLQRNASLGGLALMIAVSVVIMLQRNKISKEKARSEELLLNILPAEVAEELKEKGSADAQLIEQVTVLFTDFKGFTAMSEQLSPKELVRDLHECFSAFDLITQKYGLEKIKTIGDSYMAAGGLPTPNTTHAADTINAAFEMLRFIEEGKARKIALNLPYFEIRIGIHTGPVVAGIVGVKKFQYDIWGDTVNTASRMESSGEVGKVNISETTYELVKDKFNYVHRGKITAKGKGEIDMYFVTA